LQLENKVATITGASKGIGKALAIAFAGEGVKLTLASRTIKDLEAVSKEITATGGGGKLSLRSVMSPKKIK